MARLMDMKGTDCGEYDGSKVADGFWTRRDDAPDEMSSKAFIMKLGAERIYAIFCEAVSNPAALYPLLLSLTGTVTIRESFPLLVYYGALNVFPASTAAEVWS